MGVGGSIEAATVEVIHSPTRAPPLLAAATTPGRVQPSSVACEPIWEYRRGDEWVALPRETQGKLEAQCAAGSRGSPVMVVLGRNAWTADTQSLTMNRGTGQAPLPLRRRFELVDHAPSPIFERKPPIGVDESGAPVPVPHTSIPVSLVATARAHDSVVYCGTFGASGREVLTCARDGTMKLWEVDTGFVRVNLFPVYDVVLTCALSRRNNLAAIGTADSRVCMYRVGAEDGVGYAANAIAPGSTIDPTFTLPGHQHKVYGVAFTADAKRLVSGSMDSTVRLWDTSRGECVRVIEAHEKAVFSVTTSPVSPNYMLSASDDTTMVMHDLRAPDVAGPPIVFRGHTATLWTCDMSYDETHLASSGMDGQVLLWDKRSPAAPLRKVGQHDVPVHCVEFMPEGNRVLSCARDSTWRLWSCEPRDGPEMLAMVNAHDGNVFKVTYNAARSQVLSCGADGDIKLWKLHE